MMNKKGCCRLAKMAFMVMLARGAVTTAMAAECEITPRKEPLNLTIPVTVQLPINSVSAPVGSVLYKKEASLAQLTGSHRDITGACIEKIRKNLTGRISSRQRGLNTYDTVLPGLGIRVTAIYDKAGQPHKEWILPFTTPLTTLATAGINTDDIRLRFETVKTGAIKSGTYTLRLPSLLSLNDNSLVVNLALQVLTSKAHCGILVPEPQVDLPPIDAAVLASGSNKKNYPVAVNLSCLNTQKVSISIEGLHDAQLPSVFRNVAPENTAGGVGIEMLYNGSVMMPGRTMDIALPQQQGGVSLPLSVRYARTNEQITQGQVKAQLTLRINYL